MSLLELKNLAYFNISPFNLILKSGNTCGFSGPSGSGKTLLLRAIADLDPHSGDVLYDGKSQHHFKAHFWRKKVALLPSESQWWFDTVGPHFHNLLNIWLSQLGFDESVYDWQVNRLSSGEKQRLALLRLLNNGPKVLLLDEPTANLDAHFTQKVEQLIAQYIKEHKPAVFWISHDVDQLTRMTQRQFELVDRKWQERNL
jgi:ABC-type iron transport system FetAB ATPase subunit